MNVFLAVTLWGALSGARAFTSTTTSTMPSDGFVGAGTTPACLASLFEQALVTATCHQDWDRNGRWFMRLISSGIPSHPYGQGIEQQWSHLVKEQQWDFTIPLIISDEEAKDEDEIDAQILALRRDVDPVNFLIEAAREDRPIGIALNGVPFFSPLTPTGADTVNPLPGKVAENETLFDQCAGSLQANTGAYGYRVMPPCLYGGFSTTSILEEDNGFEPAHALIGFELDASADGSLWQPPDSPLLGFAMDGRRLYGPYDSTGSLAGGLDVCNGRWEENEEEEEGEEEEQVDDGNDDGSNTSSAGGNNSRAHAYTYRATPSFPYLIGCWGPAGTPLDAAVAAAGGNDESHVVSEGGDYYAYSETENGFLLEVPKAGCPAGSFLNTDSGECEACRAGTYGKDAGLVGLACPGSCPRGYYCPDNTATPTLRCPAGTFGAMLGMKDESCSGKCQPGYFCLSGSVAPDSNECGSMVYYCPEGSGQRIKVSDGYYTTNTPKQGSTMSLPDTGHATEAARRIRSAEVQCQAGTFCAGGRRRPCPPGTFGATPGLGSPTCSGPCPAGNYCPEGAVGPVPCPAGSFGGEEGLSTEDCSGQCAMGHYCPAGSVSAYQYACPAGRFGGARGLTDGLCAEEHVCPRAEDAACLTSLCDPGYFCPPGSISARAHACGSGEYFCPRGSGFPTPVDTGHYTYVEGSTNGGFGDLWSLTGQTTRTDQAECQPGYYCVNGARVPCPVGTVGSSPGLASPFCSGFCPAGYYCGEAEPQLGERCGGARWYCPEGSSFPSEVGLGNYTVGGLPDRRIAQAVCPAGAYCQEGVSLPCPAGTYGSLPGLSSPACSGPCPAGRYCPSGTSSSSSISSDNDTLAAAEGAVIAAGVGLACPAGRYGVEGLGAAACAGPCQAGFFCPEGSTSARERQCGSGYFCPTGSGSRTNVTLGWFAVGGDGESTRSGQLECSLAATTADGGYHTPPSGMSTVERCPDNTVGWNGTALT